MILILCLQTQPVKSVDPFRICVPPSCRCRNSRQKIRRERVNSIVYYRKETAQNARGDAQWGEIIFEIAFYFFVTAFKWNFQQLCNMKASWWVKVRFSKKATKNGRNFPGQLISKCLFGVLNSSQKRTKTIRLEVP